MPSATVRHLGTFRSIRSRDGSLRGQRTVLSAGANGAGRSVLVVLHGEAVGGASLSIMRLAPGLEAHGWRLTFWAPQPSALFDELRARGLTSYGAPRPVQGYSWAALRTPPGPLARISRAPAYFAGLRRLIREMRPAVLHANSLYSLLEAGLARSLGVPTVLHVHEMVRDNPKGGMARWLAHAVNDVVLGVSKAGAASLSTTRARAGIVYEGVTIPPNVPERVGRGPKTVVGSIGVVARRKGIDVLVEAARMVREQTRDVEFRLVGAPDDPLERRWAERVLKELAPAGIAHECRADVPTRLAQWDLFALPSRTDPFPLVVLEAMASGLPVIGTRVDGIAEQVTPEVGRLVEPDDAAGLAAAILELHADPPLRQRLGAAARARVEREFPLERQIAGISEAYLTAASGR